jgi:predicted nucleic acid-binding protein
VSVLLDTDVVLALYDSGEPDHEAAVAWLSGLDEDLVTTPLAVAEMDHLVHERGGEVAREALWRDLDAGAYIVRWWADALRETLEIARQHAYAGLCDASLVALSGVLRTNRIATFDTHFRSLTTPRGEAFVLLPADA